MRTSSTLVFAALACASSSAQVPGTLIHVSVDSAGVPGNFDSQYGSISADGRFVTFHSQANNLVPGDTNHKVDVFVRDMQAGTMALISVDSSGAQGDNNSAYASIDATGRFIVFASAATNLVPGDTNGVDDVFVHDMVTGQTSRVSVSSSGAQAIQYGCGVWPGRSISADGAHVIFTSQAAQLVAGDTNGLSDAFVHDLATGVTERVSVKANGVQLNGASVAEAISADGNLVLFDSSATNAVQGDTNGVNDYFVKNRMTGAVTRVNVDANGVQDNATTSSFDADMSDDGRYVAFRSYGTNLVPNDLNGNYDMFVKDTLTGAIWLADVNSAGQHGNHGASEGAFLTNDGRFVAFESDDPNLAPGFKLDAYEDAFVHDHLTGATLCYTHTQPPQQNGWGWDDGISPDGRFLLTTSVLPYVPGMAYQVYVVDRGPLSPMTYCSAGTTTNGCTPAISASADPSVSFANACSLAVTGVEGQRSGLLFYGVDNANYFPLPWGNGTSLRCIQQPAQRTPVQVSGGTDGACDGAFTLDWDAYQQAHPSAMGNPWSAGSHVFVQAWFRDPPAPLGTNLSNAVVMTYVP